MVVLPGIMAAQSAIDAYRFAPSDIKGTARFVAMGGAFGALGGDLSCLGQNPGGIGIYRKYDIGTTIGVDLQQNSAEAFGAKTDTKQSKFLFNNIGGVMSINLYSETFPNFNLGFTYNKAASFNRHYKGSVGKLSNSMSNYFAGLSNREHVGIDELTGASDPYLNGYTPWGSILAYDGYLMYNLADGDNTKWIGQWNDATSGSAAFDVEETGSINEYNFALGGNIKNIVFWGMDFAIADISYTLRSGWGEALQNAYIDENFANADVPAETSLVYGPANWTLGNYYHAHGTGFTYKFGVIVKPIQELRLGFAFHTPTWYALKEDFNASLATKYGNESNYALEKTNAGFDGYNNYNYRSPWKFIFSTAGVIGNNLILSADYELATYGNMKFSEYDPYDTGYYNDNHYLDDWGYGPYYVKTRSDIPSASLPSAGASSDPYYYANQDIKTYFKNMSTFRLGAEYRVIPQFSLRAGFAYQTSPVNAGTRDNHQIIYTAGTNPSYTFDNDAYYLSLGAGYRYRYFYVDLAYQYKHRSADFHAYTPDPSASGTPSPQSKLSLVNNNVVLTMGFRF